jgi:alpha-methylacyl-CoA racemase
MTGPLSGYRIIEIGSIGPGPFAAMMLSDMGAEVIRVERGQSAARAVASPRDTLLRGRRNIALDLKHPEGLLALFDLVEQADALIEGFRPGVMERLGVGPDACLERNAKLVYGRMTGWGQTGPYAQSAGHDINYIALAGALAHFGRVDQGPVPPLNLVGDFGGGGMFLAFGVVCALLEAQRSGSGQVVDAAMVDGSAVLMSMFWSFRSMGIFDENHRGTNMLDTGAPFYDVYECHDGEHISLGAIEPQFYAQLLQALGLADDPDFASQLDTKDWPTGKERLREVFLTRSRDEWCSLLEHTDVCFAPVLRMSEAANHPHNVARGTFVDFEGVTQPAPAPRFSRTPAAIAGPPSAPGRDSRDILLDWGFSAERSDALLACGAVVQASATGPLR